MVLGTSCIVSIRQSSLVTVSNTFPSVILWLINTTTLLQGICYKKRSLTRALRVKVIGRTTLLETRSGKSMRVKWQNIKILLSSTWVMKWIPWQRNFYPGKLSFSELQRSQTYSETEQRKKDKTYHKHRAFRNFFGGKHQRIHRGSIARRHRVTTVKKTKEVKVEITRE